MLLSWVAVRIKLRAAYIKPVSYIFLMEFILKIDVQGLVRWLSQEVLLHKYGDLSLNPQHPCEKLGKVVHACKPSPGAW